MWNESTEVTAEREAGINSHRGLLYAVKVFELEFDAKRLPEWS